MSSHRLDGAGLCEAGQALDQQVAVGEQADHHALDDPGLAEDLGVHGGLEGKYGFTRQGVGNLLTWLTFMSMESVWKPYGKRM
jgi:hypothetical protein